MQNTVDSILVVVERKFSHGFSFVSSVWSCDRHSIQSDERPDNADTNWNDI